MKLVAIHTIEPGTFGVARAIEPGETFSATALGLSEDQVGRLVIEGHARVAKG